MSHYTPTLLDGNTGVLRDLIGSCLMLARCRVAGEHMEQNGTVTQHGMAT